MSATIEELLNRRTLPAIVVHGGAWVRPGIVTQPVIDGVARAADVGFRVLEAGGSATDAVEAAVVALEEDPQFNAGRGSCLTSAGTVEMDASLMVGETLAAGAVANVSGVRNPIRLARKVMTESDHVLLVGDGAWRFGREVGVELVVPAWHVTQAQRARYEELHRDAGGRPDRTKLGTVGAVAVDLEGHVAAATSTGGTAYKRPGRVGDSPLIGSGTYADDATGAVSCTGHGESIMKLVLAKAACDLVARGESPMDAAQGAADLLRARLGGDGGLIVVAPDGRAGWAMNTPRMSRAFRRSGMTAAFALV